MLHNIIGPYLDGSSFLILVKLFDICYVLIAESIVLLHYVYYYLIIFYPYSFFYKL